MKQAVKSPFESIYGFKGPGFTVDDEGNIIANSITTSTTVTNPDESGFVDFTVTESGTDFLITELGTDPNPSITLARQSTYTFDLSVPTNQFTILGSNQADFFNTGLSHSDGSTGEDAQGKTTGTLRFTVPINAPNTLYYSDIGKSSIGTINVIDATGRFGILNVTGGVQSTSATTGSITVNGGVGVKGNLFVDGTLNVAGSGIADITSTTNLNLGAANAIVLKVDGNNIGTITDVGLSIPVINSEINNTVIGNVTPSTATFTSASIVDVPVSKDNVTNKSYVDTTATALAIAFGL